ncbi:MAG: hypothetical protein WBA38_12625 [Gordonia sp. (in: high G+C Gram-positive bacteria)]|uniref:hypothetical protein n=1 Tax=Gordonia sp. (in: high G+C Gram-positive bacteria) TaxID=84139 RepID=UPI003C749F1A
MTGPLNDSPQLSKHSATPWLIAAVVVLAIAVIAALVVIVTADDEPAAAPATVTSSGIPGATSTAPATTTTGTAAPQPPVAGAYAGAGGPRPAGAEPLPTYVGKYSKLESAHLLTPTGGIGCDFNATDQDGKQGQCGVRKFAQSSPFGCESIGGSCKQKWLFLLADDRVGVPVGSTGTTGWMNQPANDGYTVPRVQYGRSYYFQDWVVASASNGLTVWNSTTGSGVFLSNERAQTFDGPATAGPTTPTAAPIVFGSMASNGKGLGTAKPASIYYGGSPSSIVEGVSWSSWGGDRAEGGGTGNYVAPGRATAQSVKRQATVVAFAPGTCNGQRAYTRAAIYFPGEGQSFDASGAVDICFTP